MADETKSVKEKGFEGDTATTAKDKNAVLSDLVGVGVWSRMQIVKIKRIETGNTGWEVTYRVKSTKKKKEKKKKVSDG